MMKNMDTKKMRYLGIALIALGVFAALNMWSLLPVLILGGAGAYVYTERRKEGRFVAGVQGGLWLVGLAVLLLIDFVFPGVLLLAGASLLLRGHEYQADRKVSRLLARLGVRLPTTAEAAASATPTFANPPVRREDTPQAAQDEATASTGKTTRL
jgi:predicted membrane-bound mannosyltransferase